MKLTIGTINWLHPKSVFLMESLAALVSLFDVFELPPLLSVFFPRGSLSDGNWYLFWTSLTHGHDRAVKSLPYSPCLSDALADKLRFSRKLPTYPSPEPTFCPKWEVSVNWRRLLQGLIKQREIELSCDVSTGQYQSSSGLLRYHEFTEIYMK